MLARRLLLPVQLVLLALALGGCVASSRAADWRSADLLVLLTVLTVVSDWLAIEARGVRLSGAGIGLVLAMTLLGPAPAVAIALVAMAVDIVRRRLPIRFVLINVVSFTIFPLAGGLLARLGVQLGADRASAAYGLVVFAVYVATIFLSFSILAVHRKIHGGHRLRSQIVRELGPMLPSEMAAGTLVLAFALIYQSAGAVALTMLVVALFAFQALTRALLLSQERAEQLTVRSTELASLQIGVLAALVQTLSLRDKMTARHSAAVARYAKAIAEAAGASQHEQELVHTAGLLHDIGKFIFPDRILFADRKLTEDDWEIVKRHPGQGARVVGRVSGYGPVAEIIHAHHERIDGKGYPRSLAGDEIPRLSRMISIADTYDVMTARDSYRDPVSSEAAIAELRRVSGTQLDGELVEVFIALLAERNMAFQHTTDADFERELNFESRVAGFLAAPAA